MNDIVTTKWQFRDFMYSPATNEYPYDTSYRLQGINNY